MSMGGFEVVSRTYSYKPVIKRKTYRARDHKRITLEDYEIEYLETALGNGIVLRF